MARKPKVMAKERSQSTLVMEQPEPRVPSVPEQRRPIPRMKYSEEIAATLCDILARGRSLRYAADQPGMPSIPTVYKWIDEIPAFATLYARAKEDAAETLADEIVDIADEAIPTDDRGHADAALVQHQRLRVEARKWIAAKLKPKRYGDRILNEVSGPNGQPIQVITGVPVITRDADAVRIASSEPEHLSAPDVSADEHDGYST